MIGACFLTYALGFWYAAKLVADDIDKKCYEGNDCLTGGQVLSVFFCIIMGSIALGQLAPPLASFSAAKAAVYPMYEIIDREPLIDGLSNTGTIPTDSAKGKVSIDNIVFSYPSRPDINVCKG